MVGVHTSDSLLLLPALSAAGIGFWTREEGSDLGLAYLTTSSFNIDILIYVTAFQGIGFRRNLNYVESSQQKISFKISSQSQNVITQINF